jgi:glycosyltransferase involved in cell wall biosynthesis
MKILITSNRFYPDIGGIETISEILADHFIKSGHQVRLVTRSLGSDSGEIQFPYPVLRRPSIGELLSTFYWADIILQNNLEVRQLWPVILFRKSLVIGLQTWVRSSEGKRSSIQKMKLLALRAADEVIACSNAIRVDSFTNSKVIGNPYNSSLFKTFTNSIREKSICFVGRLVSDKGADMLIKAFAGLKPEGWKLNIIGDGPERPNLEKLASALGILEKVTFCGVLKGGALVSALNTQEIMVVPSLWREPFGVVALEGLACGCVLLVSDGGGLPDAVGSAGLLFRRGDESDLKNQLDMLIKDSSQRHVLRSRAAEHLENFKQDIVCTQYLKILERVNGKLTSRNKS